MKTIDPRHYDVIVAPVITEKATLASEYNKVLFKVASKATKPQIKEAVEKRFGVTVLAVNTLNVHRKAVRQRTRFRGYTPGWKKAIVTLAPGQRIDELFEGM